MISDGERLRVGRNLWPTQGRCGLGRAKSCSFALAVSPTFLMVEWASKGTPSSVDLVPARVRSIFNLSLPKHKKSAILT